MVPVGTCTSSLCLDLTDAASSHAQIMGLLAGFAVAAIAVVLQRPKASLDDVAEHDGIISLFVAVAVFTAAAFLYGVAAGDEVGPERSAPMTLAGGLAAAVAVSELAFGLLGLLRASAHYELTQGTAVYFAVIVPAAASLYVFVSAFDALKANDSDQRSETVVGVLLIVLAALMIFILIFVARAGIRLLRKGRVHDDLEECEGDVGLQSRYPHRLQSVRSLRRWTGEPPLAFLAGGVVALDIAYFLLLLYLPGIARTTWPLPILAIAWLVYGTTFAGSALASALSSSSHAGRVKNRPETHVQLTAPKSEEER